jgi:hypothetical protein
LVRLALPSSLFRSRTAAARRVLARRPWIYWFAVGVLAAWAYLAVDARLAAVADARRGWGATTPVLVATADLAPGDPLGGSVELREWPAAVAPPGALTAPAGDRVARQHVAAGDPVGTSDVAPAAGPLALVPSGWVAAPVVESPPSGAAVGDRVQVASEGVVLAGEGLVVGFVAGGSSGDVTLVAVPADAARLVAAAAEAGGVTLLRLP